MLKLCRIVLLLLYLQSCNFVSFDTLEIKTNIPFFGYELQDDFYRIEFNQKLLVPEFEKALIVKKNNVIEKCNFYWDGSLVHLIPKNGWQKGAFYSVYLNTSLELVNGQYHKAKIDDCFYYGSPLERLQLLAWNFEHKDEVSCLTFAFSKKISLDSFYRSFSLSPNVNFEVIQEDNSIIVQFTTLLPYNQKYVWSLSDDLQCVDGFSLYTEETDTFTTNINLEYPQFDFFCVAEKNGENYIFNKEHKPDKNIFGEQSLIFIFKNIVDKESALSSISLSPYVRGDFLYHEFVGETGNIVSSIVFEPEEKWQNEVIYEVKIDSQLKNIYGNTLKEAIFLYFEPFGQNLTVNSLEVCGNSISWGNKNTYVQETINLGEKDSLEILCSFSKTISKDSLIFIRDVISLESFYPNDLQNPILEEISFDTVNSQYVKLKWTNVRINEESSEKKHYYLLKIRGNENGILGNNGEFLKEDAWVYLYLK